ncbi:hypothetical protein BH10PAT1_BH10PAT1_2030 [soil metagenome]
MKRNQKGFIPIIILIIVVVLAAGAYLIVNKKSNLSSVVTIGTPVPRTTSVVSNTPIPSLKALPTIDPNSVDTTGWTTYHNSTWNFDIKLPPTWKEYLVSEHNWSNTSGHQYTADVCLYFKTSDSIPACILSIGVFDYQEWNLANQQSQSTGYGSKVSLARNSNYYFDSNVGDAGQCGQLDSFQCDRSKELPQIFSTFKFTR